MNIDFIILVKLCIHHQSGELVEQFIRDQGDPFKAPSEALQNIRSYGQQFWKFIAEWESVILQLER